MNRLYGAYLAWTKLLAGISHLLSPYLLILETECRAYHSGSREEVLILSVQPTHNARGLLQHDRDRRTIASEKKAA